MYMCIYIASPAIGKLQGGQRFYFTTSWTQQLWLAISFTKKCSQQTQRGFFNELLAKELPLEHLMKRMGLAKTTKKVELGYEILKLEWGLGNETVIRAGEKKKSGER